MLKVGQQVKVQFGTPTDKGSYSPDTPCIILGRKAMDVDKNIFEDQYLVQKTFDNECLAVAVVPSRQQAGLVKGELICTEVAFYGSKSPPYGAGILTMQMAKKKLGYK